MHIQINGVRLYFDVEGLGARPSGATMHDVPTLLLLHGGPGADHSVYKPAFSVLADVAQIVYLDHRGNGRSDHGPREAWTLAQWADDVHAFCDALGIVRPVVYGASFGGMVALAYALRHPDHPGQLILDSTAAQAAAHSAARVNMFRRLGGERAGELAHERFVRGNASPELLRTWLEVAVPLYTRTPPDPELARRMIRNPEVTAWFNRPGGEGRSFDVLHELHRIRCRTLVLGGVLDPMLPIECQRDLAAALPPPLVTYREFEHCGHGVATDARAAAMDAVRRFIAA